MTVFLGGCFSFAFRFLPLFSPLVLHLLPANPAAVNVTRSSHCAVYPCSGGCIGKCHFLLLSWAPSFLSTPRVPFLLSPAPFTIWQRHISRGVGVRWRGTMGECVRELSTSQSRGTHKPISVLLPRSLSLPPFVVYVLGECAKLPAPVVKGGPTVNKPASCHGSSRSPFSSKSLGSGGLVAEREWDRV